MGRASKRQLNYLLAESPNVWAASELRQKLPRRTASGPVSGFMLAPNGGGDR